MQGLPAHCLARFLSIGAVGIEYTTFRAAALALLTLFIFGP